LRILRSCGRRWRHEICSEEIAAEGQARNLPAFARFLQTAATLNARMINYTNVANDAQVPRQTVRLWFQILVDTMLGYELSSYTSTVKRKAVETAKFYFFDIGVVRTLRHLPPVLPESSDFGEFFEHYLFMELKAWIDYRKPSSRLS
jgi:predicted AAA+ superfamily ATPase